MPQQICPNSCFVSGLHAPLSIRPLAIFVAAFSIFGFQPSTMLSVLYASGGNWGIWCPGCEQRLSKAHWRNCQWTANGGKGHHEGCDAWGGLSYTMCRKCQPNPIWETDPQGLEEKPPEEEMEWLSTLLQRSSPAHFVEFITAWMQILSHTRKSWSYGGAVKGKRTGGLTEFDPGNWVYAHVLGLLCPTLMRAVEWNEETKGDICEALLALHDDLLSPNTVLGGQPQSFKDLVLELAPLFDGTAYCVS